MNSKQVTGTEGGADPGVQRLVLVTGPSGAGRSTAIHALEDMGFEAIDNLPLSLIPRLLDGQPRPVPLALGLDVRNRDFSAANLIELMEKEGVVGPANHVGKREVLARRTGGDED